MNVPSSFVGAYECEHGAPCEPGGITECPSCPKDPAKVKYKPTTEFHERTLKAMGLTKLDPNNPLSVGLKKALMGK